MKDLSREEMKKLIGGVMAPPEGGWCSTTFNCSDGSKATLTCEHAEGGCYGSDADSSSSGEGYGYCQENGELIMNVCPTKFNN